jgi:uncharacterized protein with HEPN domain
MPTLATAGFRLAAQRLLDPCSSHQGELMLTAAMLGLIRQTGMDIIVLTEELDEQEFFASRITRLETMRLLGVMAETARGLSANVREQLPEINWVAWAALPAALIRPNEHPLQIWVAARELTPLTVQHLIDYKRVCPELFSMVP